MKYGKVYLIGAGPGDKGLITVKGLECLSTADVIVFDKLACSSLLNVKKDDCELIYAGKEAGHHHLKQGQTNNLLVELAKEGKNVARLKGGDPFIFGRGGEEAQELRENGIEFEIIPGVSSSYAAGAYAGIPITHRDFASSFHVITGHEQEGKPSSIDYGTLSKEEGTLVFMMSLKNLPNIAKSLIEHGKDKNTPVAVIERGTTSKQKKALGTLETIADVVIENNIKTPALTMVGDVVGLSEEIGWFEKGELFGVNILATGTKTICGELSAKLSAMGADVIENSLIKTVPIGFDDFTKLNFDEYTWVIFSSTSGVDIFFEYLNRIRKDIRDIAHLKFGAVGERTCEQLRVHNIYVDCVPQKYESQYLAEKLLGEVSNKDKILLLRAKTASQVLPNAFVERGISYTDLAIYETQVDYSKKEVINLSTKDADYIVFSSASAVSAFCELIQPNLEVDKKIISIGIVTNKMIEKMGLKVYKTAKESSVDGILECILEDFYN